MSRNSAIRVVRWRSNDALDRDAGSRDIGRRRQNVNAAPSAVSPLTKSRSTTPGNRYCPVCKKFRSRNYARPNIAAAPPTVAGARADSTVARESRIALEREIQNVRYRLEANEAKSSDLENRLSAVRSENDALNAEADRLRQRLNSAETNLLRCESRLAQSQADKRRSEHDAQKLTDENQSLSAQLASVARPDMSRPAETNVVRWRSDNALDRDSGESSDVGRRRRAPVNNAVRSNTRSISPSLAKSRSTAAAATGSRYCPVCRKFRSRNYICTNIAAASSGLRAESTDAAIRRVDALRSRQRRLIDTTCDSGFTDRDSSPEQRSIEVRRRLAGVNQDLTKLTEENRRLSDELHKLRVDKAVHDTERHSSKRLFDEQRDELRLLRQENAELRAKLATAPPQLNVGHAQLTRVTTTSEKTRNERVLRDNDDLKAELMAFKSRLETEKARYDANTSLLNAQKLKLEQDNGALRANVESLSKSNDLLQHQLRQTDDRAKDVQRLLMETTVSSKDARNKERTLEYVNELQNKLADLQSKFRQSETSRLAVEKKSNEINKLVDDVTGENSRLRAKLTSCEQNVLGLEGEVGAFNLRATEFDKQLAAKDRDITRLKNIIRDLENEYEMFRKSLADQETRMSKMNRDLEVARELKDQMEKSRDILTEDSKRLQDQLLKLQKENSDLNRELEVALEEREKLRRTVQRHSSDLHTYEKLLAEKEKEKLELTHSFHDSANELRRLEAQQASTESQISLEAQAQRWQLNQAKDQIVSLKSDNDKLVKEQTLLKDQLRKCQSSLDHLQNALDGAQAQNESLQSDLVSIRQTAIKMDSVKMQLVQDLSEKECELQKAQRIIDDLVLELELVRTQISKEQHSLNQIDSALRDARDAQLAAQVEAQQKVDDARYMRERIAEYELKLELQGKDLVNLRTKLTKAEAEIQQLRRQLVEEQSS